MLQSGLVIRKMWREWVGFVLALVSAVGSRGEILTPPYFNLAEGRNITATATCGVDTEGPELYCKLVGANAENDLNVNLIQGQFCDVCDPTRLDKMHPPEFAVDGMETWWQSPPLSRGMKYNEVNLTIDLGQEFHVAYVYIRMGNSPRPGLWVLEKSSDYGKSFVPWQYFSDSEADCVTLFGVENGQRITQDDTVICTTEYSKIVPLEGGEIPISLLNNRPSANHYFNSSVLQEWTRATNVRFRFLRTKNLLGHLMSVARQDPTVTRRYFYSIKDISIGGRCMCNGHADTCDIQNPSDPSLLQCRCRHNTCGTKCERCCPGFEQKAWRQSKSYQPFICEPCNCFEHSNTCSYDAEIDRQHLSLDIYGNYEGGGVCQNCQHNTEGINCNHCKPTYYKPYNKHWNETDVCHSCNCNYFYSTGNCEEGSGRCECRKEFTPPRCDSCSFGYYNYPDCKPCDCHLNGTEGLQCEPTDGQCLCKSNFAGKFCKECASEYYNFPECQSCECHPQGALSGVCDQQSGNCTCKNNYGGKHCDQCQNGYYSYPSCIYCNCDVKGTREGVCDKETGQCLCKEGYGGAHCDQCIPQYFGYPDCKPCTCSLIGSASPACDSSGKCPCLTNFAGRTCEQCSPGYYKFPECLSCNCHSQGSNGISCDTEGRCECHNNFGGTQCDDCREGFYNFPICEECNCNPAGVVASFAGCGSVPKGELCQCKDRVQGRICNQCKPLFWNLHLNNPEGCEECDCHVPGVLGGAGICDPTSGQCVCKPSVYSRKCSECADGTYNLQESNLFGCQDCGCDIGGAVSSFCDKISGQCHCQSRVTGRTCKEPLKAHYFPTLYQYQYEVEDGRTISNTAVRYRYDERVFPNFSWKGYAIFYDVQREILQDIYIAKPSLYRMVLRYVNPTSETLIGTVKIMPENPNDIEQSSQVQYKNSSVPSFATVSGAVGNLPYHFVMNPGRWTVSIQNQGNLLLDYFVLLPEDFYLATILNQKVETPCTIGNAGLCRDYNYPNISQFDTSWGTGGYTSAGGNVNTLQEFYDDQNHLSQLKVSNRIPLLNNLQPNISYNLTVSKPGRYVLLINYVTPLNEHDAHNVDVNVITDHLRSSGKITLYSCPYAAICKQAVVDKQSSIGIYLVDGNKINVELQGINTNAGIHSIVAIPIEEWSLDYIKPKPVCIRKDGKCLESYYTNPSESKKIQFEQDINSEAVKNQSVVTLFNTTSYIYLTPTDNMIDLQGKVAKPEQYVFIVHYYQPNYPEFDLDVLIQNGQFYEAKLPVSHCPSLSGCRSLIVDNDEQTRFQLTENFMITFKTPNNKSIYLDYLLIVPADIYTETILEEGTLDRTGEFISACGNNHFNIDTTQEGFCRDSVFSIAAGYNNGALPCQCDYDGSLSFECDKFGGQCQCKPDVIGRKCEACRTGYYGFPDCKPCNCPSTAHCEESTGRCVCPPRVVGERCDQCMPQTYGYDPLIGCEECRCNPLGVEKSLQCDLLNGSCTCKENIVGRTCDVCLAGYFAFPYCEICECDPRGTTEEICDQASAECFCKKHVTGLGCDLCREGTFNLQEENTDGCTECFCFGKTTRCSSSSLLKIQLLNMTDWKLVGVNKSSKVEPTVLNSTVYTVDQHTVGADFSVEDIKNKLIYFAAPSEYLGHKLTAYGGILNYTIYYTIGLSGSAVSGPDVILEGAGTYLIHTSFEQPAAHIEYTASLPIVEANFQLPTGIAAKREHIMSVLQKLTGIYIRAVYWTASETTRLSNVIWNDAIPFTQEHLRSGYNFEFASSVEQCQCPPNYEGLSCENCARGYYRISSGPHGGYCVPCQCNGHSDECDVNTGVCLNCKHNTKGDHCQECTVGYHGNALHGTPMDCLICACPIPVASNNFASSCEVSADGEKISCVCNEGYYGARCHSCAAGYYGKPEILGEYCKPCECSGNINSKETGSCDTVTGECLRCLNNTFGEACSLCAPGYFGDAIVLKDCQACVCDDLGTAYCNSSSGQCQCKPNVIGEKCARCEVEHYGFQTGRGCIPCNCASASDSAQCDDVSGQCRCKPGVTGRACDRCAPGFWNYSDEGCISCGCKSEYSLGLGCSAETGQCECLPGVIGEKCDQCPYRWVFVQDVGCHDCDSCTHNLLDDVDELNSLISSVIIEFDSADSGFFTSRRLAHLNATLNKLKPKVELLDPETVNLIPITQDIEKLEQDSKNVNRKALYSANISAELVETAGDVRNEAVTVLGDIRDAARKAQNAVSNVEQLSINFISGQEQKIDLALDEAQSLLKDIQKHNLTERDNNARDQLKKATDLLNSLFDFKKPVDEIGKNFDNVKNDLKEYNDKLDDLYNHTQYSLNQAVESENLISKNGKERVQAKLHNIENQVKDSKNNIEHSEELLKNATKYLSDAQNSFSQLFLEPNSLYELNDGLNITIENNYKELPRIEDLLLVVQEHALNLSNRAEALDNLLTETRDTSENEIKAANAYNDIVKAIQNAQAASESGKAAAEQAASLLSGVAEQTTTSSVQSDELFENATTIFQKTLQNLLEEPRAKSRSTRSLHDQNKENLDYIDKFLKTPPQSLKESLIDAKDTAERADVFAKNTLEKMGDNFQAVPEEKEEAKQLSKSLNDANRDILQVETQLNSVNERLPDVISKLDQIPDTQERTRRAMDGLQERIKILNSQVAFAREVADRIKVGVKFSPRTTLELKNPPKVEAFSTSTHISGYFKTDKPNGLLLYLGNGNGTNLRRTTTNDYMAIEIENGYPVLTVDVGNGPQRIVNSKYVADGVWYQFIVDRTGHNVKFTIREEGSDNRERLHIEEKPLTGPFSIFNLNQNQSKLFVGGYPPQFQMQEQVKQNGFDGEIEELIIGDSPISLWNFNFGDENTEGAYHRDALINLKPNTGYRFNGNGFVIINARSYSLRARSDIQLGFKTYAPAGLLVLFGAGKTFLAIELRNGKILYQYNLGAETKVWHTSKTYNDGQWHTIGASRSGAEGRLKVDDEEIPDQTKAITGTNLESFDTINFGGYRHRHDFTDVTNVDFDGCIDNVVIMGYQVDLSQNIQAHDVIPGCPVKFAQLVSFQQWGYTRHVNISVSEKLQLSFKFKTKAKDGLIFYATDRQQNSGISLSLKDGKLKLIDQKIELVTEEYVFNDNEWHVVTVTHDKVLRIDFDDYDFKTTDSPPPPLFILYGDIYIGGLPRNYIVMEGMVGSSETFIGCIGDATMNGVVINFANSTDKSGENLGKCFLDGPGPGDIGIKPPTLAPIEEIDKYTTIQPQFETDDPSKSQYPTRGDGGLEVAHRNDSIPIIKVESTDLPTTTYPTEIPKRPPITTVKPQGPSCALPAEPVFDEVSDNSLLFGKGKESRLEYPTARGKYRKQFDFSVEIKTEAEEGIIMYVVGFVSILIRGGKIIYVFNGGFGTAVLTSHKTYNDNNWHQIEVSRVGSSGKLLIDGELVAEGRTSGNTVKIDLYPPYCLGGIRPEDYNTVLANINSTATFNGCIRNFFMNNKPMESPKKFGVLPCSNKIETGTFFNSTGGYLRLVNRFKVGLEFDIKMDIKPRNNTGLLVSIHGKRDYLILEMNNGVMKLTADNGKGAITTAFHSDNPYYFCDGQWHSLQAMKSKNVVTLSIDRTFTEPGVGDFRSQTTDTGGSLFIGGHRMIHVARGLTVRRPFVGCIRNVHINGQPKNILSEMVEGGVNVGYCPTN